MRNRKILSSLLCLLLIISLSSCANGNNVRETGNYTNNNNTNVINNYLNENVTIYDHKSIRELLQLSEEQNISYAGRFIDYNDTSNKSTMTICLVYNSAKNISQEQLLQRIEKVNSEGKVKIINAEFSYDELKAAMDILNQNMGSLNKRGLISIGLDEEKNRIVVTVNGANEEVNNEIYKLVNPSLIIFEKVSPGMQITLT